MEKLQRLSVFGLVTLLLALALLASVIWPAPSTALAHGGKGTKSAPIKASVNFRLEVVKVLEHSSNKRGMGRIVFSGPAQNGVFIDGDGKVYFEFDLAQGVVDSGDVYLSADVIVHAKKGVGSGSVVGRMKSIQVAATGINGDGNRWAEGTADLELLVEAGYARGLDFNLFDPVEAQE
ncbi:MAG: hypothetical protein GXP39_17605 [Chloroflexi bacterium]|nr:hypothetical protein [Chloroflexota bacterium]